MGPSLRPRRLLGRVLAAAIVAVSLTGAAHAQAPAPAPADPPHRRLHPGASGTITYFIAQPLDGSAHRAGDTELVTWAMQEWERSARGVLRFERVSEEAAAIVRIRWLPWAEEGAMGRVEWATGNGQPIADVLVRPDERRFRPSIRRSIEDDPLMRDVVLYFVCLHEIGHVLGLAHTTKLGDVMFSGANGVTLPVYDRYRKRATDRSAIPRMTWLSSNDVARLRAAWPQR